MVRYLVGTMVDIGRNRRPLQHLTELLKNPETTLITSAPAPAEGLFLTEVHYLDPISELNLGFPQTPSETQ